MNARPFRRGLLGAAVLLASVAASARVQAQEAGIEVGAAAPDPRVQTLDGRAVHLSELIGGRPAVLEFWATWCPLCKQLEPAMRAARAEYGNDVVFVSVGVADHQTPARQKAYAAQHALGGQFVFDRDGEAVKAFQAPHTSFLVVLDSAGKVVYTGVGGDQDVGAAIGHLRAGTTKEMEVGEDADRLD